MNTPNPSTFWKRPEGTTAKILLGIGGALTIYTVIKYEVLQKLIELAVNMYILGGLAAGAVLLFMLFTSDWFKTTSFYVLAMVSRAITANFVNIDPVSILKAFVKDMEKKLETVTAAIAKMMGVRQKSVNAKRTAEKEMHEFLRLADAAVESGNEEKVHEMTEMIGRRQKTIQNATENIAFADDAIVALQRVHSRIERHINVSKDEITQLANDHDLALSMIAASAAANEALGDTDKADVKAMAVDVIKDRVAKAKGEVDNLLFMTERMGTEQDLEKLANQQDGRRKLEELRAKLTQVEGGSAPKALGAGAMAPISTGNPAKYANVFRNNQ